MNWTEFGGGGDDGQCVADRKEPRTLLVSSRQSKVLKIETSLHLYEQSNKNRA